LDEPTWLLQAAKKKLVNGFPDHGNN